MTQQSFTESDLSEHFSWSWGGGGVNITFKTPGKRPNVDFSLQASVEPPHRTAFKRVSHLEHSATNKPSRGLWRHVNNLYIQCLDCVTHRWYHQKRLGKWGESQTLDSRSTSPCDIACTVPSAPCLEMRRLHWEWVTLKGICQWLYWAPARHVEATRFKCRHVSQLA